MDKCRNLKADLLLRFSLGINIISTQPQIFELFILKVFIKEDAINQKNRNMVEWAQVITYEWFLLWIDLWFVVKTIQDFQRHCFLCNRTIGPFETAPCSFNYIIYRTFFDYIIKSLTIANKTPPAYKDPFW